MGFKVSVKVTPKASRGKIEFLEEENVLKIWTTAPPVEGKANEAVIKQIADFLGIPKSEVEIKVGNSGRQKIVEVKADLDKEALIKEPKLFKD